MSDSGDFRGSREEKKKDETVMISSDQLSDLVASAKADPVAPEAAAQAPAPAPAPASVPAPGRNNMMLYAAIGVVIAAVVIALALLL